jgi:hypothetical protein
MSTHKRSLQPSPIPPELSRALQHPSIAIFRPHLSHRNPLGPALNPPEPSEPSICGMRRRRRGTHCSGALGVWVLQDLATVQQVPWKGISYRDVQRKCCGVFRTREKTLGTFKVALSATPFRGSGCRVCRV